MAEAEPDEKIRTKLFDLADQYQTLATKPEPKSPRHAFLKQPGLRYRKCDARGKAVVSVRWSE
jgi:hypothetical protein